MKIAFIVSIVISIFLLLAIVAAVLVCKLSIGQQHPTACKISYITICICIAIMIILTCVFGLLLRAQNTAKANQDAIAKVLNGKAVEDTTAPPIIAAPVQPKTALALLEDIRDQLKYHLEKSDFWDLQDTTQAFYHENLSQHIILADNFALKTIYRDPRDEEAIKKYHELRTKVQEARDYLIKPVALRTSDDKPSL